MPKNRAIIIVASVVALIVVALALFYFFFVREGASPGTGGVTLPIDSGGAAGGTDGAGGSFPTDSGGGAGAGGINPDTSGFENQPQAFKALRQLSSLPVAGATMFERNTETLIRYVERGSGHIFQASAQSTDASKKISNTTIPKIYEALWNQKGQGVLIRYLKGDVVQTYYASLGASASSTEEMELRGGTFLPVGISSLTLNPSGSRIFYIHTPNQLNTYGTVSDPDGSARSQIFTSPVSEWTGVWGSDNSILIHSRPSSAALGTAYMLNTRSGALVKLIGNVFGLTGQLNSDGSLLLYSESSGNSVDLKVLTVATGATQTLSIHTLPEKCVWSKKDRAVVICAAPIVAPVGSYPDSWYQGSLTFRDRLIRINLTTGATDILLEPEALARRSMDIVNISLNEKEDRVLFMDKNDLSLWLLDLTTP